MGVLEEAGGGAWARVGSADQHPLLRSDGAALTEVGERSLNLY